MTQPYSLFLEQRTQALKIFLNEWVADQINNFNYEHEGKIKVSQFTLESAFVGSKSGATDYVLKFLVNCELGPSEAVVDEHGMQTFFTSTQFSVRVSKELFSNSISMPDLNSQLMHNLVKNQINLTVSEKVNSLLTTVITAYLLHMQQIKSSAQEHPTFTKVEFK